LFHKHSETLKVDRERLECLKAVCKDTVCYRNGDFGPSGVCALPLAAGINEGGHYFRYFYFLGVTTAIQNHKRVCHSFFLHGLLSNKNRRIPIKKIIGGPPPTPQNNPILTGKWGNLKK
jgi:hypothetical protein